LGLGIVALALWSTQLEGSTEERLGAGQAVVVTRVGGQIGSVVFREIGGNERFRLAPASVARVRVVEAGYYYVASIRPAAYTTRITRFKEPDSRDEGYYVAPGTVTYIGDFEVFGPEWSPLSVRRSDNPATTREAREAHAWIGEYPLRSAAPGAGSVELAW
jgi:hypothetical protein